MARPRENTPTAGELEILQLLWETGPCTVRQVMDQLHAQRPRAYTSVMSLMNVMTEKGLLERAPLGRAFIYKPAISRESTLGTLVNDLLGRAFEGSAQALVSRLLDEAQPDSSELEQIRRLLDQYDESQGDVS